MADLNDKQMEAVMHKDGPLLILAGAGSGKTSTMTRRIAHLVLDEGVEPYSIFAVTFTNKAAGEMRDRVEALVGNTRGMWILTFHSACLRFLRMHAEEIGFSKNFAVYDPADQKAVIKNAIKELGLEREKKKPPYYLGIISDCKNKGMGPDDFLEDAGENHKTKQIYSVFVKYQEVLKTNNAMDFDDLLINAVKLFKENGDILEKYQERFRYIMVDEYQDTNRIQYELISMLASRYNNICVVGDDDQCIYQWRGADIRNILDFEKDFKDTKVIKLEQNYRSTGNILEASHSVISKNKGRKDKKLWTSAESGANVYYKRADNERAEANFVCSNIDNISFREGKKYSDFAILYRVNAQSRTFEDALLSRNIPYRVLGGLRYYDRKEIKDMMSYMRLVANPSDDIAFERIINEPKRGMGEKTVEKIKTLAHVRGVSMMEALSDEDILASLSSKASAPVRALLECIWQYSEEKDNLRVIDIYEGLLKDTGYLKALADAGTIEAEGRIENLYEFKSMIYDMEEETGELSLNEFMEKLALLSDVDNHNPGEDAVVLMTLHSAKGLEFPVVFMPGMEDGLFPGWRSIESEDKIEEERRLCYVGMTRAKERLFMSSAISRTLYGNTDYTRESVFMKEIDAQYVDGDKVFEKTLGDRFGNGGGIDGYYGEPVPKPFSSVTYAKNAINRTETDISLNAGDMIEHKKFGKGKVLSVKGKIVEIEFENEGIKKLAKNIAPITKL